MSTWQNIKGYLAGAIALIACPCHLPLTFPLLLSLTAGTALGSWLEDKFGLVFGISTVIFIVGLGLAMWWNMQEEKPATAKGKPRPAVKAKNRPASNGKPLTITLLTSATCNSCAKDKSVWEQVAAEHPLQIEIVDIHSPRGRELAARHNIFTTPTTLVGERVALRGVPTVQKARRLIEA